MSRLQAKLDSLHLDLGNLTRSLQVQPPAAMHPAALTCIMLDALLHLAVAQHCFLVPARLLPFLFSFQPVPAVLFEGPYSSAGVQAKGNQYAELQHQYRGLQDELHSAEAVHVKVLPPCFKPTMPNPAQPSFTTECKYEPGSRPSAGFLDTRALQWTSAVAADVEYNT